MQTKEQKEAEKEAKEEKREEYIDNDEYVFACNYALTFVLRETDFCIPDSWPMDPPKLSAIHYRCHT